MEAPEVRNVLRSGASICSGRRLNREGAGFLPSTLIDLPGRDDLVAFALRGGFVVCLGQKPSIKAAGAIEPATLDARCGLLQAQVMVVGANDHANVCGVERF